MIKHICVVRMQVEVDVQQKKVVRSVTNLQSYHFFFFFFGKWLTMKYIVMGEKSLWETG